MGVLYPFYEFFQKGNLFVRSLAGSKKTLHNGGCQETEEGGREHQCPPRPRDEERQSSSLLQPTRLLFVALRSSTTPCSPRLECITTRAPTSNWELLAESISACAPWQSLIPEIPTLSGRPLGSPRNRSLLIVDAGIFNLIVFQNV